MTLDLRTDIFAQNAQAGYPADEDETGPELWVHVAEAAVLRSQGFDPLFEEPGGQTGVVLNLFGVSSSFFTDDLISRILDGLSAGRMVSIGTLDEFPYQSNLAKNHAYVVRGINGQMLQLYNPWGGEHGDAEIELWRVNDLFESVTVSD